MSNPRDCVIVAYGRSAIGKNKKALAHTHPVDYAGQVLKGVLERIPQLNPADIQEIIYGCARTEAATSYDTARVISLRAGIPNSVPAITVSRFCESSSDAIALGAALIEAGFMDIVVAGGVESMTQVTGRHPNTECDEVKEIEPDAYISVGQAGENSAFECNVTRVQMEEMAVLSHQRAAAAQKSGKFDKEIVTVMAKDENGNRFPFNKDEGIRESTSMEGLAKLKPVFSENGLITAGLSSQVSDGTAALVLMSREKAEAMGVKPIARFVAQQVCADRPAVLYPAVIKAVNGVMAKTGLTIADMDTIELNEAFASMYVACIDRLGFDINKVNPNGGAMALGHPLGATGAILTCKAISELERIGGKYGLITMCAAAGQGQATIIEKL